jgi:hypothetical protein
MSAQVDEFCETLRDRLNAIEDRIKSAKTNVRTVTEKGERAIRQKADEIRGELESRKDSVEQFVANLQVQAQQKVAETTEEVGQWKAQRDARKLNARADRAEEYAVDAIDFSVAAIDEAEGAVLEAVLARLDADAAQ